MTSGTSWNENAMYDFCFKTYGVSGGPPVPILMYNPTSHDFGDMSVGTTTDSTSFEIWNGGLGTLTYTLSEVCDWVDVTPLGGSSNGEHDTITVDVDTSGLSLGFHSCDILINSNGGNETFIVDVTVVPLVPVLSTISSTLAGVANEKLTAPFFSC